MTQTNCFLLLHEIGVPHDHSFNLYTRDCLEYILLSIETYGVLNVKGVHI